MKRASYFKKRAVLTILLGLIVLPLFCGDVSAVTGQGDMAVRRVVLYKSGVGYFEMRGSVKGGETVRLYFRSDQMNDLLKSLTVLNLSGGKISSIVYDSTKTVGQMLSDYTFKLESGDGLPQVLRQLQGSNIELITGSTTTRGTIVGVQKRIAREDDVEIPSFYLAVMDNKGDLRSFNIDEIGAVKFLDERLDQDIRRYLKILFDRYHKDEKAVVFTASGEGDQEIFASYMTEVPVWKATYRIVLSGQLKEGRPFLQGWAIVDNVTRDDWKGVQLSLVSGLPISFIQNLYDPIFKKRPVIQIEEEVALAPGIPEAAMRMERAKEAKRAAPLTPRAAAMPMKALGMVEEVETRGPGETDLEARVRDLKTEVVTREVGELFEYKIDHPVTIERNQSALVPIVAKEVDGETVDLYNEKTRAKNPLAAIWLKNTTSLMLEGGPLTVMQGGSYAGEALIKTVRPGEKRFITYAVDLGLHVNTKQGSKSESVDRVVINRGIMRIHRGVVETKTYNLDNKDDRAKAVIIEHPYHSDWRLINEEKPIEITDNYMRFRVMAQAQKLTEFTVQEMRDMWETIMVTNLTPDDILILFRKRYISGSSQKYLEKIVGLKAEIAKIERDISDLKRERTQIFDDQKRLRENLRGLGQTVEEKNLRSRYIKQLNEQETQLEKIKDSQRLLEEQLGGKRKELDGLIGGLEQDLRI
jgi:hypothetical protein